MIDEKKIEEAKEAFIADKKILGIVAINDLACGFKEGANWALEQFLKDLWHPGKKVPEYDKWILVQYKNNRGYNTFFWEELNFFHQKNRWTFAIDRWLYIDDLLPKKGGNE